jgi:ATP-dependent DNA helicase RecG
MLDFLSSLSVVPGMGPKRFAAMKESGIETIGHLLYRFPLRYLDRSTVTPLNAVDSCLDKTVTVTGTIEKVSLERGRKSRLRALLKDETGTLEMLWFQGTSYYKHSVRAGKRIVATGKITRYGRCQMVHPLIETVSGNSTPLPVLPLYSLTETMRDAGIGQRFLCKSVEWIFSKLRHYPQSLPGPLEAQYDFPPLSTCLRELHFPTDVDSLEPFRNRIRYEELYQLALSLSFCRRKFALPGRSLKCGPLLDAFLRQLPFTLTKDQKRAADELLADCADSRRMHRLLQGDVGSGKTVVALIAALPSLHEGLQVVWMAPTEVLAQQTFSRINNWLTPLGFSADLLTSSGGGKSAANRELRQRIATGGARFIIGTHALLQSSVIFRKVGITIIDEQHRFGTRQRLELQKKDPAADFLLMSATPIPQTLAQTLYGDLDIVTIRSLPPGRIPVATHPVPEEKRGDMERFIKEQITQGAQVFYIVPRIETGENDAENPAAPRDLKTTFSELTRGTFHNISSSYIHGRLDSASKERILKDFAEGSISLLVATSVIEVGIDVSSATVIVIESSERFGLAQLHQLRGRVGRGDKKSYCFLLTSSSADTRTGERLKMFCREHDGFAVAELDLKNRGPGEVTGYRQSGWDDLIVADILRDAALFSEIRKMVDHHLSGILKK